MPRSVGTSTVAVFKGGAPFCAFDSGLAACKTPASWPGLKAGQDGARRALLRRRSGLDSSDQWRTRRRCVDGYATAVHTPCLAQLTPSTHSCGTYALALTNLRGKPHPSWATLTKKIRKLPTSTWSCAPERLHAVGVRAFEAAGPAIVRQVIRAATPDSVLLQLCHERAACLGAY